MTGTMVLLTGDDVHWYMCHGPNLLGQLVTTVFCSIISLLFVFKTLCFHELVIFLVAKKVMTCDPEEKLVQDQL